MTAMRVDAKVVMLGKESVGKTSLVERYVHHRFLVGPYQNNGKLAGEAIICTVDGNVQWLSPHRENFLLQVPARGGQVKQHRCSVFVGFHPQTIGAAFVAKPINVGDKLITLGIWDTAGSERYEAMSRIYYRGARAAIVCYDLTDHSSFLRARFWVKELQTFEEHCKIYLCGTKNDLIEADRSVREVDYHDVQDFAEEIEAQHFETSSKTGNNVDELFMKVAEDFSNSAFELMQDDKGVDLGQKKDSYLYTCCHH